MVQENALILVQASLSGAMRSPDTSWIKLDRWNALTDEQKSSFAPIYPDFVVELRSASDTLKSLLANSQEYIENGCVWVY
jgi:Uma2 family endonuclease